jgi:hypothetical protein
VRLDFVEYIFNAAGSRVFNVAINGTQVLTNFDIWKAAGGEFIATARSFTTTASSTGAITIGFTSVVNNSMINGLEIYPGAVAGNTPGVKTVTTIGLPADSKVTTLTARPGPSNEATASTIQGDNRLAALDIVLTGWVPDSSHRSKSKLAAQ